MGEVAPDFTARSTDGAAPMVGSRSAGIRPSSLTSSAISRSSRETACEMVTP